MARNVKIPLAACVACVLALAIVAAVAHGVGSARSLDVRLFAEAVTRSGIRGTTTAADLFAHLGDPVPLLAMLAMVGAVALWRRRPADAVGALAIVAGANLTTQILKDVLSHPRLQEVVGAGQIHQIGFPSGHATAAASIAIAFVFVSPLWLRPLSALLGAALFAAVGASVIVLGWHFPSDVLGGALVASAWGLGTLAALRAIDPGRELPALGVQLSSEAAISVK